MMLSNADNNNSNNNNKNKKKKKNDTNKDDDVDFIRNNFEVVVRCCLLCRQFAYFHVFCLATPCLWNIFINKHEILYRKGNNAQFYFSSNWGRIYRYSHQQTCSFFFHRVFVNLKVTQRLIGQSSANRRLCYFQLSLNSCRTRTAQSMAYST